MRLRRFAVVVRLIDLDARVEETDDPTDVIPGHMPARFADAAALRALHDPLVAVLFPRPNSSAECRADGARPRAKNLPSLLKLVLHAKFPPRTRRGILSPSAPRVQSWEERPLQR